MIPAPSLSMTHTAPSRAARRDADRRRKREAREAMRAAGIPDARLLDAAIVDALRDLVLSYGVPNEKTMVAFRDVLRLALDGLQGREQQGIPLNRAQMHLALANRLAPRQD
ncbi:hypothetical protein HCU64_00015 [Methylobacterium sp. C25]|uniref:hypothetical protein n=1 Tax=Methylobacterium sp. C25 TaxID=2721622 RepID=UPI001F2A3D62|nr:hypothetical protein [Methylobacterium sp. C25]MCE4222123.1 hypothetical protein [Methylobacterium sp. C25]